MVSYDSLDRHLSEPGKGDYDSQSPSKGGMHFWKRVFKTDGEAQSKLSEEFIKMRRDYYTQNGMV